MITKLHCSAFPGYDEYLLDDNTLVFHDKDSGEDIESEWREVPSGTRFITPKQLAAQKAYKERGKILAARKQELGKYIYADSNKGGIL